MNQRETTVVCIGVTKKSDEQITKERIECVFQGLPYLT
jgi:hypothetical protein